MSELTGADRILSALDDQIAVAQEFAGAPIEAKLAPFGLEAEDVREALEARWELYEGDHPDEQPETFVAGFTEGLLAGLRVGSGR